MEIDDLRGQFEDVIRVVKGDLGAQKNRRWRLMT